MSTAVESESVLQVGSILCRLFLSVVDVSVARV